MPRKTGRGLTLTHAYFRSRPRPEVLFPNETAAALDERLRDYRAAGTQLGWIVDPVRRGVSIRRGGADERWLSERKDLEREDALVGFSMPVARLFATGAGLGVVRHVVRFLRVT